MAMPSTVRAPVVVDLLPRQHPTAVFADVEPVRIAATLGFYSHTTLQARYEDETTTWRNFVGDIDTRVFSNLAVLEPFTLASWSSSKKHLVMHELLLSAPATNRLRATCAGRLRRLVLV